MSTMCERILQGRINVEGFTKEDVELMARMYHIPVQITQPAPNNAGWVGHAVIVRKVDPNYQPRRGRDDYDDEYEEE